MILVFYIGVVRSPTSLKTAPLGKDNFSVDGRYSREMRLSKDGLTSIVWYFRQDQQSKTINCFMLAAALWGFTVIAELSLRAIFSTSNSMIASIIQSGNPR